MKPYIVCHMVASLDGRIDCSMVDKISGEEYYTTLAQLDCEAGLEGRVTLEHYTAEPDYFVPRVNKPVGEQAVHVAAQAAAYTVAVDTKGRLRWPESNPNGKHLICIVSEQAQEEYLDYLREKGISYIAVGAERIDLAQAMEILGAEFGIKRLTVLGGGHINGGFLEAGLLDEVSLLLAPGIDGRRGQTAVFDGISDMQRLPVPLKLQAVEQLANGVLWLRYLLNAK